MSASHRQTHHEPLPPPVDEAAVSPGGADGAGADGVGEPSSEAAPWTHALDAANLARIRERFPERSAAAWLLWTVLVHECYRRQSATIKLAGSILAHRTGSCARTTILTLQALHACKLLSWQSDRDRTTGLQKVRTITVKPVCTREPKCTRNPCASDGGSSNAQTYNAPIGARYMKEGSPPPHTAGGGVRGELLEVKDADESQDLNVW